MNIKTWFCCKLINSTHIEIFHTSDGCWWRLDRAKRMLSSTVDRSALTIIAFGRLNRMLAVDRRTNDDWNEQTGHCRQLY